MLVISYIVQQPFWVMKLQFLMFKWSTIIWIHTRIVRVISFNLGLAALSVCIFSVCFYEHNTSSSQYINFKSGTYLYFVELMTDVFHCGIQSTHSFLLYGTVFGDATHVFLQKVLTKFTVSSQWKLEVPSVVCLYVYMLIFCVYITLQLFYQLPT